MFAKACRELVTFSNISHLPFLHKCTCSKWKRGKCNVQSIGVNVIRSLLQVLRMFTIVAPTRIRLEATMCYVSRCFTSSYLLSRKWVTKKESVCTTEIWNRFQVNDSFCFSRCGFRNMINGWTLNLLNIWNGLVHLSAWTVPFISIRSACWKIYWLNGEHYRPWSDQTMCRLTFVCIGRRINLHQGKG